MSISKIGSNTVGILPLDAAYPIVRQIVTCPLTGHSLCSG